VEKEGLRDAARGSAYAPSWPPIPVPGSPLDKVLTALTHVRTVLSFDDEGQAEKKKLRSLHAKAVLEMR